MIADRMLELVLPVTFGHLQVVGNKSLSLLAQYLDQVHVMPVHFPHSDGTQSLQCMPQM